MILQMKDSWSAIWRLGLIISKTKQNYLKKRDLAPLINDDDNAKVDGF